MNKRIKKKKFKQFQKQFCEPPFYEKGYAEWQCKKCGWDSLSADDECKMGKILWQRGGFYDYGFEVEYKCPVCGSIFSYVDGA